MHIFFASQSFYPSIGGVSTYLYNLARELESSGNQVSEIHLRQPGETDEAQVEGINIFRVPKEPLDKELLQGYFKFKELVYNESHWNRGLFNKPASQMPGFAEFNDFNEIFGNQIRELVGDHPGEIVHVHDFQLLYLYRYIPRGIPVVFTWHIPLAKNISTHLARYLVEHMSQFDAVVFSSPSYIKTAVRFGLPKEKVRLIYPLCNTNLFVPRKVNKTAIRERYHIPPKAKVILCVQRIDAKSGHDTLIKAFAKVREAIPTAHLVFVGGKSISNRISNDRVQYEQEVQRLIETLNLKEHITFTGTVPYEKLPPIFNASDVYALLSLNEGFGLSLTEAMACGLPAVGSRVGGIPTQIIPGRNGFLVDPKNADRAAQYLIRLIKDLKLRTRMGKEALRMVERKFKLEYGVEKHLGLYMELKNKKQGLAPLVQLKKNEVSAIAVDFDRTITDRPGQLNLNLIRKLKAVNPNLIMATGRELKYVRRLSKKLTGWRCFVAENGAIIYFPKTHQTITFNSKFMRQARRRLKVPSFPVKRGRISLTINNQHLRQLRTALGPRLLSNLNQLVNADERSLVPKGVNKGKGLGLALELLNLNPEKIVVIGDGENDIDLFRMPGFKVAVANAHHSLKKLADYVTEAPSTKGVEEVIAAIEA